jgi:hypothetical protein
MGEYQGNKHGDEMGADETRWQHTEHVQHREHVLDNTQNMFNTESTFLFHSYSSYEPTIW